MWVSPLLAGADLGGAHVMSLMQVEDRLELSWRPYQENILADNSGDLKPRVLLQSVDEFEVGYLSGYGAKWSDQWPGADALPVAVRLTIQSGDKYWPELVIRLNGAIGQ
jgi:hypothetical protein